MRNVSAILWIILLTVCLTIILTTWNGVFTTALISSFSAVASFVQVFYRMPITRNPSRIPWMILSVICLTILSMLFVIAGIIVTAFGIVASVMQLFIEVPLETFLFRNTPPNQLTQPLVPALPAPQARFLPPGLRLIWVMSWVIWNIIALIAFTRWDAPYWIIASNLVLFFFWGGVMAQRSGEVMSGVTSNLALGVPTITCVGVIWFFIFGHFSLSSLSDAWNLIGLILGLLIQIIALLFFSLPLGFISIILGGGIGKGVYLLQGHVNLGP